MSSPVSKIPLALSLVMVIPILTMTVAVGPSLGGESIEQLATANGSIQDNGTAENGTEDRIDGEMIMIITFVIAIVGMLAIIYVIILTDRKK